MVFYCAIHRIFMYYVLNTDRNEGDKLNRDRNWTVLFIGGASGMGKSSVAYELAHFYNVNVMEVDDICQAVKAMTTREILPAIHYWSTGINWMDIGVSGNVKWLIDVSKEMIPGLKAIVDNHIEADVPVIIEGDFIHPEFAVSFENPKVKSIYIYMSRIKIKLCRIILPERVANCNISDRIPVLSMEIG